ncbi:ABC transporter substrate-binding protein [Fulvimarina sp. MAC3]|uniref:ABC transporter substrate-binding protein n=1 Tax=Fulvimarina sp. MAC3 TaxID=3148887 RepID=UPI0031FD4385
MKILKAALLGAVLLGALSANAYAQSDESGEWQKTLEAAKGQTVYFNAWGGSQNINDYIDWVGTQVEERYDISLEHVKLDDTANAVAQVVAEKAAGRDDDGGIDLIWINGENFASMKEQGLLADGFATELPNWSLVDQDNPSVTTDFTVPTDGKESPWGGAKFVFFTDPARFGDLDTMPDSTAELLKWSKANPGHFSYPAPPDFMGSSFLKQVLLDTIEDRGVLEKPVDEVNFDEVSKPLWDYLDELQPVLWRSGRDYPQNYPAMKQLLADGELGIIFAFNPAEASNAIANFELPDTVRSFVFSGGTLGNTHFVAIPYNSGSKEAAKVVANFLMSPEAQIRKERPEIWGDPTILDVEKLTDEQRQEFEAIDRGVATLGPDELGPVLPEPHPSWMTRIEDQWLKRYGS